MDARLLIACTRCRRQYDVSGMRRGEHVRCLCGELQTVPGERAHEARILHCSGCGGKLRENGRKCEYCGGEITLAERDLGPACPICHARLRGGARYCSECGIEIRPQVLRCTRAASKCPRCAGELALREMPHGHYTECHGCGGIWLDPDSFQRTIDEKDAAARAAFLKAFPSGKPPAAGLEKVRYIACPTCGHHMNRKNFGGSGVIIDWCKGHGLWFDSNELEKIVAFAASGGLERQRQLEIEKLRARAAQVQVAERKSAAGWGRLDAPVGRSNTGDWFGTLVDFACVIGDFFA